MYKIETHLHTPLISPCAVLSPEELVLSYKEVGYAAVTVTDHYKASAFSYAGISWDAPGDKLYAFLEGYRRVKEVGDQAGLKVYYGAELQFYENDNDYLVYGFSDQLLADPKAVCSMGIAAFSKLAKEDGALLIQAHPFRHDCHDNRNNLAIAYARRYQLLMTGGADCHGPEDIGRGGIDADYLPEDSLELAELLRSGRFTILGAEGLTL